MSSDGPAASSSGWFIRPKVRETGSIGSAVRTQVSLPIGHSAMAAAGHREPYESRGSSTVLGAPGGETPSGDSSDSELPMFLDHFRFAPMNGRHQERTPRRKNATNQHHWCRRKLARASKRIFGLTDYFGGRSSPTSHAVVDGSCIGSTRSHSQHRSALGPLPSTGITSTIKAPQCSHRSDELDWPMLQFDIAPIETSILFLVEWKGISSPKRVGLSSGFHIRKHTHRRVKSHDEIVSWP